MGFLFADTATIDVRAGQEAALFHRMGCNACPLRERPGRIEPTGAKKPRYYFLGEAPGCISGDSLIDTAYRDKSLQPKGVPINELVGKSGFYVYSYDLKTERFVLGLVRRVWKTGRKATYKVTYEWSWGSGYGSWRQEDSLIVTGNHQFMLRTPHLWKTQRKGKSQFLETRYLSIDQGLSVGMRLQPFNRGEYEGKGKRRAWISSSGVGRKTEAIFLTEQKLGRSIESNENCHHKDDNSLNDTWRNLECLTEEEHWRHHSTVNNAMNNLETRRRHKAAVSKQDYKNGQREGRLRILSDPILGAAWLAANKAEGVRRKSDPEFYYKYLLSQKDRRNWSTARMQELFYRKFPEATFPGDNHKIISIEPLGIQDVYDMEVEEFHNFAVNGVFVHNSTEIKERSQFVGESGKLLRPRIPKKILPLIRWNNCVRSWPPGNRTPERPELESCRPSVSSDIEQSQPIAIFGFGNVPLTWVSGFSGIIMWRGRRMPVRVGKHACWYYPMLHPSYLLRQRRKDDRERGGTYIGSEDERMFVFDLERAFEEVEAGLPLPDVHDEARARKGVEVILAGGDQGVAEIEQALEWAASLPAAGMDYETNALRPYTTGAKILTAAIGTEERSIAFPIHHREARFTPEQKERIIRAWKRFLVSKTIKYVHNLAFEMEWTAFFFGEEFIRQPTWVDTATDASILDQRVGKRTTTGGCLSLEFLVQQYFGFNLKQISNMNTKRIDFDPLPKVLSYNGMDAKYHLFVGQKQEIRIKQDGLQEARGLAQRRVPTVVLSQLQGIPVNQAVVKELQKKYRDRIKETEATIQKVPIVQQFRKTEGHPFNPHSAPEVIDVFYKYLKRKECVIYDKYKKADRLSADETVLSQIDHPLAKLMLDLRGDAKRKSTYLDPVAADNPDAVLYPDGLLHTNYNTFFAETGRLSANDPPVQTYPKRDDEAKEVRLPVEAPKDHVILAFDYGQIQARIVAMFSKDKAFCKALWERYDIHQDWTEQIAHDYPQRIGGRKMLSDKKAMKDFRTDIKNQWTFPLLFGARAESVAGYLNIPINVIRPHYDAFWRQFSGVKDWQEKVIKFYHENGWVECLTGRRRRGPLSLNELINSPVQGTECEIVMEGMCSVVETRDPELIPELMIHDDLTWLRVPKKRAEAVAEKVLDILLAPPFEFINVPITIELLSGTNWCPYDKDTNPNGLQEIGAFSSDTWFK